MHKTKPWFSAQFHPEAKCGARADTSTSSTSSSMRDPKDTGDDPDALAAGKYDAAAAEAAEGCTKVLLLGSGGLSIGQAGEFDYSGSQAIKALKEEGLQVVLINPNIASVQTNVAGARRRRQGLPAARHASSTSSRSSSARSPEGIILSMGGQTGLNCGIELEKRGILEKYGVRVLGTSVASIEATEDRDIFSRSSTRSTSGSRPRSRATPSRRPWQAPTRSASRAWCAAPSRSAASARRSSTTPQVRGALRARRFASTPQVLVEKSLKGWKEVEYEVVRDAADNCITVCNMENFDPLGVHTGDSIVVAPSQTLTDEEYHMLRTTAIKVVRHLGIVGECNIQYALDPDSRRTTASSR